MPLKDPVKRSEYNREYQRKHYEANKEYYLAKASAHNKSYRRRNSLYVQEYKTGRACELCNNFFPPKTLEFHHKLGEHKVDNVSDMVFKSYSIKAIEDEIKKCLLICANCHRGITYE